MSSVHTLYINDGHCDVTHWLMKPQAALGNWRWWERDIVRPTTRRATSRLSLNFLLHLVWAEYHQPINLWNHSDLIRLLSKGAAFNKHKSFCSPIRRFDALVCWLQFRNKNYVHHFTPTTFFFWLMFWLPVSPSHWSLCVECLQKEALHPWSISSPSEFATAGDKITTQQIYLQHCSYIIEDRNYDYDHQSHQKRNIITS